MSESAIKNLFFQMVIKSYSTLHDWYRITDFMSERQNNDAPKRASLLAELARKMWSIAEKSTPGTYLGISDETG